MNAVNEITIRDSHFLSEATSGPTLFSCGVPSCDIFESKLHWYIRLFFFFSEREECDWETVNKKARAGARSE